MATLNPYKEPISLTYTPILYQNRSEEDLASEANAKYLPVYREKQSAIESEYSGGKQSSLASALARGMARSSYLQDREAALDSYYAQASSGVQAGMAGDILNYVRAEQNKDLEKNLEMQKYNAEMKLKQDTANMQAFYDWLNYQMELQARK